MTEEKENDSIMSVEEVAQVQMYVDWMIDAFNNNIDTLSHGVWRNHPKNKKMLVCGDKVLGTMKNETDSGYITCVGPERIKALLIYVKHLEHELNRKTNDRT